jgi:hypothetical protein
MNHYFEVMGRGGDFAKFYTADVTWTTTGTGQDVRGPSSVRDFIVALHNNMSDAQTRRIGVSDGHAYLEGDCLEAPTGTNSRISYCVAYDVVDDRIAAMRCYGPIAPMCPYRARPCGTLAVSQCRVPVAAVVGRDFVPHINAVLFVQIAPSRSTFPGLGSPLVSWGFEPARVMGRRVTWDPSVGRDFSFGVVGFKPGRVMGRQFARFGSRIPRS